MYQVKNQPVHNLMFWNLAHKGSFLYKTSITAWEGSQFKKYWYCKMMMMMMMMMMMIYFISGVCELLWES
jgi:hypothetical protein